MFPMIKRCTYFLHRWCVVLVAASFLTVSSASAQVDPNGVGNSGGSTPPFNPQDISNLLGVLNNVNTLGSGQNGASTNAGAIADALKNLDMGQLSNLANILNGQSNNTITGIAGQIDIGQLGSVANAFGSGNLSSVLQGAFDALNQQYSSGNLSTSQQQQLFGQMQSLQSALQNYGAMQGITNFAKGNIQNLLDQAGLGDLANSMKDLLGGNLSDPQALANALSNIDWDKLNGVMSQLGVSGPEALKDFLPAGTNMQDLTDMFNAFKNGGIDALIDQLGQKIKDKIAAGIGNIPELQNALDKLNDWKNKLSGGMGGFVNGLIGGLFGNSGGGAANVKANCKSIFSNSQAFDFSDVPAELVYECMQRGIDPPMALRKNAGLGETANATSNSVQSIGSCRADGICTNSSVERTVNFANASLPANNPNFQLPDIPWKDITKSNLPCGAIGSLTEMAIQALWKNVKIQMPSQIQSLLNSALSGILGGLFGGGNQDPKIDCQDGTFWGTLNSMLGLVLGQLGGSNNSGIIYDITNNTFQAPEGALLTLPTGASMQIDLTQGGANFNLPAGGSFVDINGNTVTIPGGTSIQFGANGTVTFNGQTYNVNPNQIVNLNTNGVLGVPVGATIPVPPNSPVIPMGPATTPPGWAQPPSGG